MNDGGISLHKGLALQENSFRGIVVLDGGV